MQLDISQIMEILPHRPPLLLVDRVLYLEPLERAVAVKQVAPHEPGFNEPRDGARYLPELFCVEALAQLAAIVLTTGGLEDGRISREHGRNAFDGLFAAIPDLHLEPFPGPGPLTLKVELKRSYGKMYWMDGEVFHPARREPIASGRLMFYFTKKGNPFDPGWEKD